MFEPKTTSKAFKSSGTFLTVALAFGLVSFFDLPQANAQSRDQICQQLSVDLAALGNSRATGGNRAKYRQYDVAVRKQGTQINRAKRALRRNGCVGVLRNTRSQCRSIADSLRRMEANLVSLKRERASFAPQQARTSGRRQQILAAMTRNGCNGESQVQASAQNPNKPSRRRTLLEQVFGVRTYDNAGNQRAGETGADLAYGSEFGTFRTLCVRKSDGYYFPISFSTVPDRFAIDEETCRNMCPGSDVDLYVHRMPFEDSENMISYRTEIPYADEPFAFAYRKEHNPENRCRFSVAGMTQSVDTVADLRETENTVNIRIGVPNFRKDPTLAPDVYDNLHMKFDLQDAKDYIAASLEKKANPDAVVQIGDRKVRIVGPAFFPVQ